MQKRRNIVLTGFMGTGKTSVGKILAKKLGFKFVDVDDIIEKKEGMKISDIFKKFGENRFREIEAEMIKLIAKKRGQVISTGGGAVLRDENMDALKSTGVVFCLTASEDTIFERVKNSKNRPLLQFEDLKGKIRELLRKRMDKYMNAHFLINTEGLTPEEVAEKIIEEYERFVYGKNKS